MKLSRLLLCSVVLTLSLGLMHPVSAQSGCGSGQIPSSCGCFDPGIMQRLLVLFLKSQRIASRSQGKHKLRRTRTQLT
jgi:hypothetical protein